MRIVHSHQSYGAKTFLNNSDSVVIGRQKADLDLTPDLQVSQRHACISYDNEGWWVEDLGSRNGTQVNGLDIHGKMRLAPSDEILIGETILKVEREERHSEGVRSTVLASDPTTASDTKVKSAGSPQLDVARKRLTVFYELGAAFASTQTLDSVLTKLIQQVLEAIPMAQRGALLLKDSQGQLLLKAHVPEGEPSPSFSLAEQALEKRESFIWKRAGGVKVSGSLMRAQTQCAIYAPLVLRDEALGVMHVDSCIDVNSLTEDDLYLLMAVSYQAAMVVKFHSTLKALKDEASIRDDMMRWFSPKIAKRLADRGSLWSGGERVQATMLCADIRGFTALSAKMEPKHVVEALNEAFELVVPIILKYDGTIDKYVGDSIMAMFGSPDADPNQWEHAVRAGIEMQAVMKDLAGVRHMKGREPFEFGIGIHTGEILHGILGARDRMEFTIIGDAVNKSARFCDGAGKGEVVISKEVYERVFRLVDVTPKTIVTKHPTTEGNLQGYLIKGLKQES